MPNSLVAQAGKFDRRVTIIRAGTPTKDSFGESVPGAAVETTRWCWVRPMPGYERFQNAQTAANAVWRFIFRWGEDLVRVTDSLRTDDGRTWDIKSADPIARREGWEVLAAARMEQP